MSSRRGARFIEDLAILAAVLGLGLLIAGAWVGGVLGVVGAVVLWQEGRP